MKFIFALYHNPSLLIFDEPTSNLDYEGKDIVYRILEEEKKKKCIIIATNEKNDLELCNQVIKIEDYQGKD
jgi:ABC-type lipoprotein export system ATPase subunit